MPPKIPAELPHVQNQLSTFGPETNGPFRRHQQIEDPSPSGRQSRAVQAQFFKTLERTNRPPADFNNNETKFGMATGNRATARNNSGSPSPSTYQRQRTHREVGPKAVAGDISVRS
jgi:hypothetical protein